MSATDLRDQIAKALAEGFMAETGSTWLFDKGLEMADVVLAVPGVAAALAVHAAMIEQAPVVIVPRRFLVEVDSITSLVAYRHRVPEDIRAELIELSYEARRMYEALRAVGKDTNP